MERRYRAVYDRRLDLTFRLDTTLI